MFDTDKRPLRRVVEPMSNPLPIKAEHSECKHCEAAIIRWPDEPGPFGKKWIHNPTKGFRRYRCDDRSTVAEPK